MNVVTRNIYVIFVCLMITACATPTYYKLSRSDAEAIKSTKLIVVTPVDHLDAEIEHSNSGKYAGGMLLGAFVVVDSAVDSSRERGVQIQIAPIQATLKDSGISKAASEILAERLRSFEKLRISDIEIVAEDQAKRLSALQADNKYNDILLIKMSHSIDTSLRHLNTQADVALYLAPSSKRDESHRRVVQDTYTFSYRLPISHTSDAECIADWASNGGNEAKLGMKANANNIAAQIIAMFNTGFGGVLK